jgi:uncharacterized membrane protein
MKETNHSKEQQQKEVVMIHTGQKNIVFYFLSICKQLTSFFPSFLNAAILVPYVNKQRKGSRIIKHTTSRKLLTFSEGNKTDEKEQFV